MGNVDDDLVQEPCLQTLPRDVGAQHDHIGTGRCVLGHLDRVVDVDVEGLTFDALHVRRVRG